MEATGSPIISDGEQRWSSFATYPIADTLAGTGLAENLGPGGQFFAIFADGHGRQLPKLTGGPLKYNFYAADTLAKSLPYATKPMKQAVIAPSMLALLYPLNDPVPGYSREEFEEDIVQECTTDIRKAFEAGAARVSIDFTEGRLATREDPRNPWTGAGLLPHFIDLNNRVLANFSDAERAKIGIHTCPGGDRDSVHSADVPVQQPVARDVQDQRRLLPHPARLRARQGPRLRVDRPAQPRRPDVLHRRHRHAVTRAPRAPQEICDAIVRAADFIPKERLGTTDDCGFSPFSIDEKPNHGSPDYAREIAFQKIASRVEGTRRAAEKLGVS